MGIKGNMLRTLLSALLIVTGTATAVVMTSSPAHAALLCSASADLPWKSPWSGRVYFNGNVQCSQSGDLPNLITMTNSGHFGNSTDYENKKCGYSWSCYSTGGETWLYYRGYGQYCGLIDAWVTTWAGNTTVWQHVWNKRCVYF